MSFSLLEVMDPVSRRAHVEIDDSTSDDYADALSWTKSGIRWIQRINNWSCHKDDFEISSATTPALTAGTYKYDMTVLKPDFRKLQADSIRYGDTMLKRSIDCCGPAGKILAPAIRPPSTHP